MRRIVLLILCSCACVPTFVVMAISCKCEPAEDAELKEMTQNQLQRAYCVAEMGSEFNRKMYKGSGDKKAFKEMKVCREQMERTTAVYREKYGVKPPRCEKLNKGGGNGPH